MDKAIDVVQWYNTQAGILAATLAVICGAEFWFILFILKNFRADIKQAFGQTKECAEQRHSDAMTFQDAVAKNTQVLAVISNQLKPERRRDDRE